MRSSRVASALALILTLALVGVSTGEAEAAPPNKFKGENAFAYVTVSEDIPRRESPLGNVHSISIDVSTNNGETYANVFIEHLDCDFGIPVDPFPMPVPIEPPPDEPDSVEPPPDEPFPPDEPILPPPPPPCDFVGFEYGSGSVDFDIDKKLTSASADGVLVLVNDLTGDSREVLLDVDWSAIGEPNTSRSDDRFTLPDGTEIRVKSDNTWADAEVSGSVADYTLAGGFGSLSSYSVTEFIK